MTFGGICLMLLMCGFFTGLFLWCIWKVARTPGETERIHPTAYEQIPDPKPLERESHRSKE